MNVKRIVLFMMLSAVLLVSIPAAAQDGPVTMSFWVRDANTLIQKLVDEWNASHDNQVELTEIPASEFVTKFAAAIAGGEAPDIAGIDLIYTPAFAAEGQLVDITDKVQALPYLDDLSPAHVALGTYEGRNYAVPFAAEGSFLIYNKDLFRAAGLDPEAPPTNWEELLTAARAITALGDDTYGYYFAGNCAGCNAFTYLPLIWASGGDVLSEDYSVPTLDDPAVKEALQLYRTMWEEGLIPEGAQVDDGANFTNAFGTGKIGMAGTGAFGINTYKTNFPDLDFGVTLLPGKDGGTASFGGGDVIGIPAGSEYVDQAWEFIEWLLSDDVQLNVYAANDNLPLRLSLADNEFFDADPRLKTAASTLAVGHTPYSLVYNALFNDGNGPWLFMLQTAIFDGDIDGAIAEAQQSFADIMAG
ncbi:MAG: sugar ABC transporter substrate-binding protein [Chloroflexi bacterium]|nr:sugar ABC transporter substrate-binding protein [Chloroflexota bacterium]MCC6896857.1 sugar ABC transporter substrate-binding protein [Anaerolineae bacterium]